MFGSIMVGQIMYRIVQDWI